MYKVIFNQILKDHEEESLPKNVLLHDLERALAFASLLQKLSTPEVKFEGIIVEPYIIYNNEKEKK